jgi:nucleotide-binding universal stress UspA family protein
VTIIVGYGSDEHGKAALPLAILLARSTGMPLVVCSVLRKPWPLSLASRDDAHEAEAAAALEQARQGVPGDVSAEFTVEHARSIPAGLLNVARKNDAAMLVVGSTSRGMLGHITLGSTTSRLMHSSHVSVAIAPRGYRVDDTARLQRLTVAYGGSEQADRLAVAAAGVAVNAGAPLRLASFLVRHRPEYTMTLGAGGDTGILQEWEVEMQAALQEAVGEIDELPDPPASVETVIGKGATWDEALEDVEWDPTEILMVGSSAVAAVARVFLGSRATQILHHSPVPVVLLPRARAEELAEEAEEAEPA